MKVMFAPRQGGIWRSVDTTIHSLRGRLATLLQIPITLLSCFVVKFISWVLEKTRVNRRLPELKLQRAQRKGYLPCGETGTHSPPCNSHHIFRINVYYHLALMMNEVIFFCIKRYA